MKKNKSMGFRWTDAGLCALVLAAALMSACGDTEEEEENPTGSASTLR